MKTEKKSFCGNKEEYVKYLCGNRIWEKGLYIDPDTTHQDGRDSAFYLWIEKYLNAMEKLHFNSKWNYSIIGPSKGNIVPSGIKVSEGDKCVMYLRSDQLGFSAPQGVNKCRAWDNRYPYSKYINLTNECDMVADVIWDTRSQGGFFVWPITKYESEKRITWKSQYNCLRGVGSYIEDRADVTLWEVKMFYAGWNKFKNSVGTDVEGFIKCMNDAGIMLFSGNDKYLIFEWLKHFESFQKYVEFFSFQSFLKPGTEDIINLVNGEEITEEYILDVRNKSNNRIALIGNSNSIMQLLRRLQYQTNSRTDKMLKMVEK